MDSRADIVTAGSAGLFAAQGVASLLLPPSEGNSYRGTSGDVLSNLLFTLALTALAWALLGRARARGQGRAALVVAGGCVLLAASTVATVVAGEERWDAAFMLGFALAALGWLVSVVLTRSPLPALLLLGLVLTLAFFDSGGGLALALALALSLRPVRAMQVAE